jgi:hypothetical protein
MVLVGQLAKHVLSLWINNIDYLTSNSGAQPAFYTRGTGGSFAGDKTSRA